MEDRNYLVAERGYVYEWQNPQNDHFNYCLVVSSIGRCKDRLISVLFLSTDRNESSDDIVKLNIAGSPFVVHCDLITYTHRKYLTEKIMKIDNMDEIDQKIKAALNLDELSENPDYRRLYTELLDKMINSQEG